MKLDTKLINIKKASQYPSSILPRIPSSIFVFDALTGGGLPLWKFSIFHGSYSSGKTAVSLKIMGNFLRKYPDKYIAYIDFEDSFDKQWVSNFVDEKDMDRILVVNPDFGEQGVDYTVELAKQDEVGFIFVDSLAEMIPTNDIDKSASDDTVGLQAKLINKLLRKLIPIVSIARKTERPLACILINQERAKVGARVFGAQTQKAGGYFQEFVAGLDIRFYRKSKDEANETKASKWIEIGFKIEKSKITGILPYRSGAFRMSLLGNVGEVNNAKPVAIYGIKYGLIKKEGKYYSVGKDITTKDGVIEYFSTYPKEYFEVYDKLVEIISKGE